MGGKAEFPRGRGVETSRLKQWHGGRSDPLGERGWGQPWLGADRPPLPFSFLVTVFMDWLAAARGTGCLQNRAHQPDQSKGTLKWRGGMRLQELGAPEGAEQAST